MEIKSLNPDISAPDSSCSGSHGNRGLNLKPIVVDAGRFLADNNLIGESISRTEIL